jgi:hypothetical protein
LPVTGADEIDTLAQFAGGAPVVAHVAAAGPPKVTDDALLTAVIFCR